MQRSYYAKWAVYYALMLAASIGLEAQWGLYQQSWVANIVSFILVALFGLMVWSFIFYKE